MSGRTNRQHGPTNEDLGSFFAKLRRLGPAYFQTISKSVDPAFETCVIQP